MKASNLYNKVADDYEKIYVSNLDYKETLKKLTKLVPTGKILDLGCGNGLPVAKFLTDKGYNVTGIDISKEMILRAKKNVPNARFINSDITEFDLGQNKFEAITSFFLLFTYLKKRLKNL